MLYVVTGGSGSGKSEYAENTAIKIHNDKFKEGSLYYVATMEAFDEESRKRIERHRKMRKGKGFITKECAVEIEKNIFNKNDVVLIECISNLTANEMYSPKGRVKHNLIEESEKYIVEGILKISKNVGCVVAVTNEVFSDGCFYDSECLKYIEALAYVNRRMGSEAEGIREIVCGIEVKIK